MGKDALTNSPTSSRSVPNLKISIIMCPSSARCGAYMKEFSLLQIEVSTIVFAIIPHERNAQPTQ